MKNFITTAAFVVGLSVIAGQLSAAPGFGPGAGGGGGPGGGRGGAPDFTQGAEGFGHLEFLADHLGLTDEQENQINEIIDAAQLAAAVDRERERQVRAALQALVEEFDAGEAQVLADELGGITARLAYSRAETRAEIHQLFTPEQLQLLEELKARRSERMSRFVGRPQGADGEE
jgi:Spy/CpxP family protein refolding chaperone